MQVIVILQIQSNYLVWHREDQYKAICRPLMAYTKTPESKNSMSSKHIRRKHILNKNDINEIKHYRASNLHVA